MFITGPDVIKTVTGEDVDDGGRSAAPGPHNTKSGNAHYLASDEDDAIEYVKDLLAFLPSQQPRRGPGRTTSRPSWTSTAEDLALDTLIPDSANQPYDMHDVIDHDRRRRGLPRGAGAVRAQHHHRLRPRRGPPGRHRGQPADAVRRHPRHRRLREGRALRPLLRRVQHPDRSPSSTCPGFLPGIDQEYHGIIRRGAKLLYAYAEATVPSWSRSSPARPTAAPTIVMGSKQLGADINLAWPTAPDRASWAPRARSTSSTAATLAELEAAGGDVEAKRAELIRRVRDHAGQPLHRGRARLRRRRHHALGDPRRGRQGTARCSAPSAQTLPPKKHGNIPL